MHVCKREYEGHDVGFDQDKVGLPVGIQRIGFGLRVKLECEGMGEGCLKPESALDSGQVLVFS